MEDISISILICLFSIIIIFRQSMSTIAKGLFAIGLNRTFGFIKSSFVMRITSAISKRKVPKGLPELTAYERVSDRTFRVLGLNPGPHTLQGTNTWLMCGSKNTTDHILIDTGEDSTADEYVTLLFDKVFPAAGTKRLSKILLTHGHGDHQGGVLRLLKELEAREMLPLPTIYKRQIPNGLYPVVDFPCEHINDCEIFKVDENTTLQACYTPGHTDDHVGFILHEDNALLSGDCVLGCGTSVFDDLFDYMNSLKRIRKLIVDSKNSTPLPVRDSNVTSAEESIVCPQQIHTIYPGHGPVICESALEKIDEYIMHRDAREQQILRLLGLDCSSQDSPMSGVHSAAQLKEDHSRTVEEPASSSMHKNATHAAKEWHASWDVMSRMYGDIPFIVKVSAMHNVSHHLEKLQVEGRVENRWPDLWRLKQ